LRVLQSGEFFRRQRDVVEGIIAIFKGQNRVIVYAGIIAGLSVGG